MNNAPNAVWITVWSIAGAVLLNSATVLLSKRFDRAETYYRSLREDYEQLKRENDEQRERIRRMEDEMDNQKRMHRDTLEELAEVRQQLSDVRTQFATYKEAHP